MLAGYISSSMKCQNPAKQPVSSKKPCKTNKVVFDGCLKYARWNKKYCLKWAGSTQASNDLSGTFAPVEMYMMGLFSKQQFLKESSDLVYCNAKYGFTNPRSASYDRKTGKVTVNCHGGIQFVSPQEIVKKWKPFSHNGKQMKANKGKLRVAVVMLYPNVKHVPQSLKNYSPQDKWVTKYFGHVLPAKYKKDTRSLGSINFSVTTADRKGAHGHAAKEAEAAKAAKEKATKDAAERAQKDAAEKAKEDKATKAKAEKAKKEENKREKTAKDTAAAA